MNELKSKYFAMFGELPPLMMTMGYENKVYKILMEQAIATNEPITQETLNNYIEKNNVKFDVAD